MQRPLGNSSWNGDCAQLKGRERVGRLVTINMEKQKVTGTTWEQMPLMKRSESRESYLPFRTLMLGKG